MGITEAKSRFYLPLQLQYFSEGDDNPDNPTDDDPAGNDDPEDTPDEPEDKPDNGGKKKTKVEFTPEQQAEVDRIVKARIARAEEKAAAEAEKKRLEDQGEYKDLYEQLKADFESHKRTTLVNNLMLDEGFDTAQIDRYSKYIEGDDEEAVKESVKQLKEDVTPKKTYGDPSPGPGRKKEPEQKDGRDIGKERYARLKGKIRK